VLVQYLKISHNHLAPNPQLLTIYDLSISFYVIETPSLNNLKVGHKNQQTDYTHTKLRIRSLYVQSGKNYYTSLKNSHKRSTEEEAMKMHATYFLLRLASE
jgi:hypothetical protein